MGGTSGAESEQSTTYDLQPNRDHIGVFASPRLVKGSHLIGKPSGNVLPDFVVVMGGIRSHNRYHSELLAVVGTKNLKTHFIIGMILPEQLGDGS